MDRADSSLPIFEEMMSDEPVPRSPDQRAEKPKFLTRTSFTEFKLPPEVLSGLSDIGFTYCTPIQARTLPVLLLNRDVAGQAQTGTGKTGAFLVTVFTRLLTAADRQPEAPGLGVRTEIHAKMGRSERAAAFEHPPVFVRTDQSLVPTESLALRGGHAP